MGRLVAVVFLLFGLSHAWFYSPPDVWKEREKKIREEKRVQEERKKKEREEEAKREKYRKLYEETMEWLPEPDKVPPVLREVWKNPKDEELKRFAVRTMYEWMKKGSELSNELGWNLSQYSFERGNPKTFGATPYELLYTKLTPSVLKPYIERGLGLIYFYSPTCPYCKMSEPMVRKLESLGVKVFRFRVEDYGKDELTTSLISLYDVRATPTSIWFLGNSGNGYKYVGVLTEPVVLNILKHLEKELKKGGEER